MALDELLDGDRARALAGVALQRLLELVVAVDADRALGAGARARLEDERVALALGEGARLGGRVDGRAGRGGHPGLAQRLLHRRLVAAQPRRAHARAGDAARLAHLRRRHRVRLDGRLERVDPDLVLEVADRLDHLVDVRHRADAVVAAERTEHLVAEVRLVGLADAVDVRAHRGERVHEATLVRRERRLHEDDVHGADAIGPPEGSPRSCRMPSRGSRPETPAQAAASEDETGGVAPRAAPHPSGGSHVEHRPEPSVTDPPTRRPDRRGHAAPSPPPAGRAPSSPWASCPSSWASSSSSGPRRPCSSWRSSSACSSSRPGPCASR